MVANGIRHALQFKISVARESTRPINPTWCSCILTHSTENTLESCATTSKWQTKHRKLHKNRNYFCSLLFGYSKAIFLRAGTVQAIHMPYSNSAAFSVGIFCPVHFSFWTVDSSTVVIRINAKSALAPTLTDYTLQRHRCALLWMWSMLPAAVLCVEWEFMKRSCSIAVYHQTDSGA